MSRPVGSKNKKKVIKAALPEKEEMVVISKSGKEGNTQVILLANNKEYYSLGNTVLEALNNLPLHYLDLKTKGTIVVRRGEYIAERFFFHRPLKFLIRNEARRQYWAQLLEAELKSKHG